MPNMSQKRPEPLWTPTDKSATNIDKFRLWINKKRGLSIDDFKDLHSWSISRKTANDFWVDLFEFLDLKRGCVPTYAYKPSDYRMFPPPQFFPDIRVNFVEHIFRNGTGSHTALYACREGLSEIREVSWHKLYYDVKTLADALRSSGLSKGDRVAAVISNCVEAIVSSLAVLSIGAIFSTCSPDMGATTIMDRLNQIEPRFVFIETSTTYNGKQRPQMDKARTCLALLQKTRNFQDMVLIPRGSEDDHCHTSGTISWTDLNRRAIGRPLEYEQVPFSHPGFIVYSSGTTGSPKCIVHSAMGALMKIKKDYILHLDVHPGDTIYQYTTTGWIMWLMVLSGLSYGGKTVLYDGSPLTPDPMVTLRLVQQLGITLFGTSARFLSDLKAAGIKPRELADLSSLRTVSSTGSVLQADVCEWFHKEGFPSNVHLISGSGGTDLAGSLVNGDPTSPEYAGEIQRPALGMAIDILDPESATPVSVAQTGQPGELVCLMPFPSQPVQFWGNDGSKKYEEAYFSRYGPNVWQQGDFVCMSPTTGGYFMLGRSDGVLNPSGVRFGSAEIYTAIANMRVFEETICVGQRRLSDRDETVFLFVKMKDGELLTPDLVQETKTIIHSKLSKRHVPAYIFQVPEIPYTINGKKIELAVKRIISGQKITPSGAVANPESLKFYERFVHVEELNARGANQQAKL